MQLSTVNNFEQCIDEIFLMLSLNYGNMWSDPIRDEDAKTILKRMWMNSLKNFLPATIQKAIQQILHLCPTYPPKIGELYNLCEEISKASLRGAANDFTKIDYIKSSRMPDNIRALWTKQQGERKKDEEAEKEIRLKQKEAMRIMSEKLSMTLNHRFENE